MIVEGSNIVWKNTGFPPVFVNNSHMAVLVCPKESSGSNVCFRVVNLGSTDFSYVTDSHDLRIEPQHGVLKPKDLRCIKVKQETASSGVPCCPGTSKPLPTASSGVSCCPGTSKPLPTGGFGKTVEVCLENITGTFNIYFSPGTSSKSESIDTKRKKNKRTSSKCLPLSKGNDTPEEDQDFDSVTTDIGYVAKKVSKNSDHIAEQRLEKKRRSLSRHVQFMFANIFLILFIKGFQLFLVCLFHLMDYFAYPAPPEPPQENQDVVSLTMATVVQFYNRLMNLSSEMIGWYSV